MKTKQIAFRILSVLCLVLAITLIAFAFSVHVDVTPKNVPCYDGRGHVIQDTICTDYDYSNQGLIFCLILPAALLFNLFGVCWFMGECYK